MKIKWSKLIFNLVMALIVPITIVSIGFFSLESIKPIDMEPNTKLTLILICGIIIFQGLIHGKTSIDLIDFNECVEK